MMFTLQEPRQAAAAAAAGTAPASAVVSTKSASAKAAPAAAVAAPPLTGAAPAAPAAAAAAAPTQESSRSGIVALLRSPGFMSVTLAAALNDVGSYALIAWQSTFYERVYGLSSAAYAPVLAALLPIGGILGGVGEWRGALGRLGAWELGLGEMDSISVDALDGSGTGERQLIAAAWPAWMLCMCPHEDTEMDQSGLPVFTA